MKACEGITDEFLDAGLVEFAIINPHLFLEGYDFFEMTFDGMKIWETETCKDT